MVKTLDSAPWNERRWGSKSVSSSALRSSFDIDRDRVIHSHTFRQLQHKTQVQSITETPADAAFRTRLNHVIEVAQISRGVARQVGADPSLSEAIALAHDVGHPPFGHAGERALQAVLAKAGYPDWNANTHSLHVVDQIECVFIEFRGLDLTWATREGIARHSTPFDEPVSIGEFSSTPNGGLECQIVDACDVLAYVTHDLDDALSDGFLTLERVVDENVTIKRLVNEAQATWDRRGPDVWPVGVALDLVRQAVIGRLVSLLVNDLVSVSRENITRSGATSPPEVRSMETRLVQHSEKCQTLIRFLLQLLVKNYYRSSSVASSDDHGALVLIRLFESLMADSSALPSRFRREPLPLAVANYLISLNDRSASLLAQEKGLWKFNSEVGKRA